MEYIKTKILIPIINCKKIEDFLKGKIKITPKFATNFFIKDFTINGYTINIIMSGEINDIGEPVLNVAFNIYQSEKLITTKSLKFNYFNQIFLVFDVNVNINISFLINIEKETSDESSGLLEKLEVLKYNINNKQYIKNFFIYSNFVDKKELIQICYLLLVNNDLIRYDKDLKHLFMLKFNYYGYELQKGKLYKLNHFYATCSERLLDYTVERIIYDIVRFNSDGTYIMGENESRKDIQTVMDDVYKHYADYICN